MVSTPNEQTRPSSHKVKIGDPAPDFTLTDQKGQPVSLSSFADKKDIVLYFYPKDFTSVCTAQACAFRDSYEVFKEAGAEVIGISSDSKQAHQDFASQHQLPFILLSDRGGKVRNRYGVSPVLGLLPGRVTFIIDKHSIVRHIFTAQFAAEKHVEESLRILQMLREEHQ
jgi:thioredoxin-dependent peroxiredoxin